jgi:8-oxo-dGTP pyrophosphatase MutT (NUDIX family)
MGEVAGGVVLGEDGRIVIVEQHGNSWSLPKGGVEEGESILDAARREVREETGIADLRLIQELGTFERGSLDKDGKNEDPQFPVRRRTMFLFKTEETSFKPEDVGEVTDIRWATLDEAIAALTHPKDKEFLKSVRARIEVCSN